MINRVLIIDDEEDTEVLVRLCMHAHYPDAILEIYDPKCGMPGSEFDWNRYDLLLLDFNLGLENENGLTWLAKVIRQKNLPPVIVLTSYDTEKLAKESQGKGADEFLVKTKLNPQMFLESIKRARKNYEATRKQFVDQIMEGEKTKLINKEDLKNIRERASTEQEDPTEQTLPDGTTQLNINAAENRPTTTTTSRTTDAVSSVKKRAMQPSDISLIVPGYRLLKKIGEGGMASIYLAETEDDASQVVLKVLSFADSEDTSLLRRFMREYKLIAQVQHENIVQIYERAFASEFAYIAMEYFKYGDLAQRLTKGIDSDTAISFLKQIASGLGAAHEKGIVHRDLKPANILFRTEETLAITDFGIAKTSGKNIELTKQLTMEGEIMGTIYFLSPEQIEGAEADKRSDIYSLGVIMYKILTGKHPYTGSTYEEVFNGHLNEPIPLLPEKYKKLQPLLDGLLAKDPDERFQSTEDLIIGLDWEG